LAGEVKNEIVRRRGSRKIVIVAPISVWLGFFKARLSRKRCLENIPGQRLLGETIPISCL